VKDDYMKKSILLGLFFVFLLLIVACVPQEPVEYSGDVIDAEAKEATASQNTALQSISGNAVKWMECKDFDALQQFDKVQLLTPSKTQYSDGEFADKCYTWYKGSAKEKTRLIEGVCKETEKGSRFNYWYADCDKMIGKEFSCGNEIILPSQGTTVENQFGSCVPKCPSAEQDYIALQTTVKMFYQDVATVISMIKEKRIYLEEMKDVSITTKDGATYFYSKVMFADESAKKAFEKLTSYYLVNASLTYFEVDAGKVKGMFGKKNSMFFTYFDSLNVSDQYSENQKMALLGKLKDSIILAEFKKSSIWEQLDTLRNYNEMYKISEYNFKVRLVSESYSQMDSTQEEEKALFLLLPKELQKNVGASTCNSGTTTIEGGWTEALWIKNGNLWKIAALTAY